MIQIFGYQKIKKIQLGKIKFLIQRDAYKDVMTLGKMKIKLIFAWYDFWVGLYFDKNKKCLYILPIPMFGIVIKFKE